MDYFDLKCLPNDFVGTSKPSKVIQALYEKRKNAEERAIENLHKKKQLICQEYDKIFEIQSKDVKDGLHNIRGLMKDELHDAIEKSNHDNANNLEKNQFKNIYKRIHEYLKKQNDLVDHFYTNLLKLEKDKSKEFADILKITYEEIKNISHRLPNECDEFIEMEIENVNQTILCNNRNYVELKCHLQGEIETYAKEAVENLQYIKECWVKYIRDQTEKAITDLKKKYIPAISETAQMFGNQAAELKSNLPIASSLTKSNDAREWLSNIRQSLGNLDKKAQRLILNYKQAAVIIYNRYFEELEVIENTIRDLPNDELLPYDQVQMYTPDLEEIKLLYYNAELETIQTVWNNLVNHCNNVLDNTYKFLKAASTLWKKHFKRTEVLHVMILRDLENRIQLNNKLSEPHETKLNILIDTLRQEPTSEKMKKTLESIKKSLKAIEDLYIFQYYDELSVLKKYKNSFDMIINILTKEIKRFTVMHPPDLEKDPKIQRKRASQTSEIADINEGLIPNQMIFSRFQIDAISNWQFGVWESIQNYRNHIKADITTVTGIWIKKHTNRLEKRKEIRLSLHSLRFKKIGAYINDERLNELCIHQTRFEEHKSAITQQIATFKNESKQCQDLYDKIVEDYKNEVTTIERKSLEATNYYSVACIKPILSGKTEIAIGKVNSLVFQFSGKCNEFVTQIQASHVGLLEHIKLFSEGGNFAVQEINTILKDIDKIEVQVENDAINIKKELSNIQSNTIQKIYAIEEEVKNVTKELLAEHNFIESVKRKTQLVKKDLIAEVCTLQSRLNNVTKQFECAQAEMLSNCGKYEYFNEFSGGIRNMIQKLKALAEFLDEAVPVRFYSDKADYELPPVKSDSRNSSLTEEEFIREITGRLFNFQFGQNGNTYFIKFNKILNNAWEEIVTSAKEFYKTHNNLFLSGDIIPNDLQHLINDLYKEYFSIQNQCETKAMQDTREFLNFATNYLECINEYSETYIDEYSRKTLRSFEQYFENDIKQELTNSKTTISNQFMDLQSKLKPLHGHPKNRILLEQLEIKAKTIHIDGKETMGNVRIPCLEKLKGKFNKIIEDYFILKDLLPELERDVLNFTMNIDELNLKLNEKVNLLKMMVDYCCLETTSKNKHPIVTHCQSFLTSYASKSFQQFNQDSGTLLFSYKDKSTTPESTTSSSSNETITNTTPSSHSKSTATSMTNGIDDDPFLSDLKERYYKYYKEIEKEDFEQFHQKLDEEWSYAVKNVMELYAFKEREILKVKTQKYGPKISPGAQHKVKPLHNKSKH